MGWMWGSVVRGDWGLGICQVAWCEAGDQGLGVFWVVVDWCWVVI